MARDWIDYDLAEREEREEREDALHERIEAKERELREEVMEAFPRGMQSFVTGTGEHRGRTIVGPKLLGDIVANTLAGERGQALLDELLSAPDDEHAIAALQALRRQVADEHADAHGDVIVMLREGVL